MGASSVTGSGPGAAVNKCPHEPSGPKIIMAGSAILDGLGGVTVVFPVPLPGGFNNYSYAITPLGVNQFSTSVGGAENADGDLVQITIIGASSRTISYMVVRNGFLHIDD